ncbi:MAG: malate dehydrogenase [Candidatus Omnitrophota bacterium]
MKISIIGAGNVGGLTAMRLLQDGLGDVCLIDVAGALAEGKALDLDDARAILKVNYNVRGSADIKEIKGSDIIIVTAGLARKPGMTREDLMNRNAAILKDICLTIKQSAHSAIVILVTNPLDLMAYFTLKALGFERNKIFGMGISLDASRFANLIARELKIPPLDVEACVIGVHGEGMLPLSRFTNIKGVILDEFLSEEKIQGLVKMTVERGAKIVSLLGTGSAYFAPSAAIANLVKVIVKDEKRTIGVSAYLNGEYGIKDVCLGVPCRLGRDGIEEIIELDLNRQERDKLLKSAANLKEQYNKLEV